MWYIMRWGWTCGLSASWIQLRGGIFFIFYLKRYHSIKFFVILFERFREGWSTHGMSSSFFFSFSFGGFLVGVRRYSFEMLTFLPQ